MSDERQETPIQQTPPANYPAHMALGVLQRTASAISPWVRPWWTGRGSAPASASSVQRAPIRMPGQTPLTLRVQRSVATGALSAGSGEVADRFTYSILQRHSTAEQIGRRYRLEPRQPATPAPAQLPLPGVQTGGRIQRSSGEMSLEELANAFQETPSPELGTETVVQRDFDPEAGSPHYPTSIAEMQEAVRRSQVRSGSMPEAGASDTVQRSPESSTGGSSSIFSAIEERVRQARQRREQEQTPSAASQPPSTGQSPETVQRSPAAPTSPAPEPPTQIGGSIAAAIQERIRQARERLASGGSAPGAPAPTGPTPAPPPASPAPPIQRSPAPAPRSGPEPYIPENFADVPRELPVTPTADPSSPGFSKTEAIRERIQRVRERNAAAQHEPQAPPSPEYLASLADPDSPNYSKSEAIRQRIEQARIQRQPRVYSTDPNDPNYSVAAHIQRRIEERRAQQAGRQPGDAASSTPSGSAPASEDPPSIAQQIQERIQAARERREQGAQPPAAAQPPTPPAAPSTPSTPSTPSVPDHPGATGSSSVPPSASVQRAPVERPIIMRDLQLKPTPQFGGPPQAKRVRALSRTQILTPERKTGDFFAGEAPRPGAVPLQSSRGVQRTIDVTPGHATPVETPPQAKPVDEGGSAPSEQSASPPAAMVQRAVESAPPAQPHEQHPAEAAAPTAASDPSAGATVQRAAEATPPAQSAAPEPPAREMVQRMVDAPAQVPSTPSDDAAPAAQPSVQRSVEASEPAPEAPAQGSRSEHVQRMPQAPVEVSAENVPTPDAASKPSTPPTEARAAAPPAVQRAPEPQGERLSPAAASEQPATLPTIQRSVEASPEQRPTSPVADEPAKPPTMQRTVESPTQSTEMPTPSTAPEAVQRAPAEHVEPVRAPVDKPSASDKTSEAATPPMVQRAVEPSATASETVPPPSTVPAAVPERVQRAPEAASPERAIPETATPKAGGEDSSASVTTAASIPTEAVPPAPTVVQRSPESGVERAPAPATASDLPQPPIQRAVERSAPSPEVKAPPSSAAETVQRTAEAGTANVSAPAERTPDTAGASVTPPSVSVSERKGSPAVQRSAESSVSQPEEATASVPKSSQRKTGRSAKRKNVSPPASEAPSVPTVQRASDASAPQEETTLSPEHVQRMPEDSEESPSDLTQVRQTPVQPKVQRAAESVESEVTPSAADQPQRGVQQGREPGETRPSSPAPSSSSPANQPPGQPVVQRHVERPETTVDAPPPAAPERVQRKPEAPDKSAQADPAASVTELPSVQPDVQRSPESTAAKPTVDSAPERIQRAIEDSSDATPTKRDAPPAFERSQSAEEGHSERGTPSAAASVTPTSPSIQRSPEGQQGGGIVDAIEEQIRLARQRQIEAGWRPRTGTEAAPPPAATSGETIQRTVEEHSGESAAAARETSAQPPVQRAVEPPSVEPPTAATGEAIKPSAPERVQRIPQRWSEIVGSPERVDLPESSGSESSGSESSGEVIDEPPPVQRSAELPPTRPAAKQPTPPAAFRRIPERSSEIVPAVTPSEPLVQRSVDNSPQPAGDPAPFRPVNRYRDPRVLARSIEPGQRTNQAELPLTSSEPAAILPQARETSTLSQANDTVQRKAVGTAAQQRAAHAVKEALVMPTPPRRIQRTPEEKQSPGKKDEHKTMRAQPSVSRTDEKVQRTIAGPLIDMIGLPLNPVLNPIADTFNMQHDPNLFGEMPLGSRRAAMQPQNLGDVEADIASQDDLMNTPGDEGLSRRPEKSSTKQEPLDLDRLAQAILPVIKRMLAIERDRRNPRPLL